MKLNKIQIDALLAYIDARIADKSPVAAESSDGGLIESIQCSRAEEELRAVLQEDEPSGEHDGNDFTSLNPDFPLKP